LIVVEVKCDVMIKYVVEEDEVLEVYEDVEEDFVVWFLVVMIMGYVDYGKMMFFDVICEVFVVEIEVGGII